MGSQAYKLKLQKKWRIHDISLVSLLEQNTTRKGLIEIKFKFEAKKLDWEADNNVEFDEEAIWNSTVYAK